MDTTERYGHTTGVIMRGRGRAEQWGDDSMGQSQNKSMSPEHIRYRLTFLQRMLPVLPVTLFAGLLQLCFWSHGGPIWPAVGPVVLPFAMLIFSRSSGITLTRSAAVVHNLSRRTILWADVRAIETEWVFGSRFVVIHEAGGRRTRLQAPATGFLSWDRAFEEKFHTIGNWWLDHRGPDWAPAPPRAARRAGAPSTGENPFAPPV
ncbi:hypothetical protein ACFWVC_17080 [Streptomyces sp. NPDC058691]|uniref:hypothetical protein n=1 Tax=Streptomyces sp. NPDC058691 TaxID=3346601 RepID=UPI00366653D9